MSRLRIEHEYLKKNTLMQHKSYNCNYFIINYEKYFYSKIFIFILDLLVKLK